MKTGPWVAGAIAACAAIGSAQAALTARDLDGVATTAEGYYDSTLNVTWLADWNHAKTSGHDADGRMTWADATAWAANLTVGTFSDWRLPSSNLASCAGYNCAGAGQEHGQLWYSTLGNSAGTLSQVGGFTNVQMDWYWTLESQGTHAGLWAMHLGYIGNQIKTDTFFAVAVHNGDIGGEVVVAQVAEPGALGLLGLAAAALAATSRRRRR